MSLVIFGRLAQFIVALITIKVATSLLTPSEMGKVSLILSTVAFFVLLLVNPVGMFINRRLHSWNETGKAKKYFIYHLYYLCLISLFSAVFLYWLYNSGVLDFGVQIYWLIFLTGASIVFNTINQTSIPSLNLLGYTPQFVILTVATVSSSFFFAVLLVYLYAYEAKYWVLGILAGQLVLGLFGLKILFSKLGKYESPSSHMAISRKHLVSLFSFSWPVMIAAVLGWSQFQGYRYVVEWQIGLASLGLFAAGYGVSAGLIAGFESVLTTYFQPKMYKDINSKQHNEQLVWQRYAKSVIPSALLVVGLIAILSDDLVRIFLGEKFYAAKEFVVWGALSEGARVVIGVYSLIAHIKMKTQWLIVPSVIGAVLSISLSIIFLQKFGVLGVGIALSVAGLASIVAIHVLLAKHVAASFLIFKLILPVGAFIALLWGWSMIIGDLISGYGGVEIILRTTIIGLLYIALQYLLLRDFVREAH
ncbi:oligosaccharide flippase family protein [Hydrogenovibrio marinus]|uniref:Polysaccharide biosynthesis protein C-terminal domain-containing protein n=1 Tax=Hydrogenovibrio marinus TaxID=28885 RepID=A0A067A2B7_HYDMR|nr:oligosaccharide flippase family protein [Hydrogenovibrio marinus]KDN96751.1 hypothetical protein EI16_10930 [Hydrogenovibrio marinus]BBN58997.1 sugar transporter [Hydrogenovibrio marinus]